MIRLSVWMMKESSTVIPRLSKRLMRRLKDGTDYNK
jgi:hypothetical protein